MSKTSQLFSRIGPVPTLFLAAFLIFSCGKTEEEVTYPERKSLTESVYASGLVKAKDQYEAFTFASGPIQEILVDEGDTVKVGTPILQVFSDREKLGRESAQLSQSYADQSANQSRIRDLELAISLAKSKKQNDSLLLVRQRRLWAQGIGTAVELEQRELNFQNSKTAYESALLRYGDLKREVEFNSKSASKNLAISDVLVGEYILKSKIDGVVYSILKEKGEMVSPQTPLAIIGSAGEFLLELQVDEYDISKVEVDQRVMVNMDSFKEQVFEAKISRIYPIMDSKSKSFTVEAIFTKAPPKLFPNLTLEANILTQVKEETLVIPRNYLIQDDRVILENGDTVQVKVGIKTYQFAEILEGITEKTALKNPIQ
ncbi:HlyD family efflux transporter periplasmic adaptor subunit [Algoriphagus lacus]|uniref:HlyD family efflux transporter periplasmic adaptor subunit n=1 Tax=Algoriphagus lacus TaxID=2056311 RepID=A0A418PMT7_9BACT|nr:efflux RND transporter periplasmic adaptor subunit [Algoriphagus lacus]RIW12566.1 HlyD family efflux transporter periplasmic adaptor subunit [Algoriphagus lacus]